MAQSAVATIPYSPSWSPVFHAPCGLHGCNKDPLRFLVGGSKSQTKSGCRIFYLFIYYLL